MSGAEQRGTWHAPIATSAAAAHRDWNGIRPASLPPWSCSGGACLPRTSGTCRAIALDGLPAHS